MGRAIWATAIALVTMCACEKGGKAPPVSEALPPDAAAAAATVALDVLEDVRLGMTADELRTLADSKHWEHDIPADPGDYVLVALLRESTVARRLGCTLRKGVVVNVHAYFEPPRPDLVAAMLERYPERRAVPGVGMAGAFNAGRTIAAWGSIDGSDVWLTDLVHEKPDEAARIVALFGGFGGP